MTSSSGPVAHGGAGRSGALPGAGNGRVEFRARSIGPAASLALSAVANLRVHGVFPSALNLEILGTGRFVTLCAPSGGGHPHAVVLERPPDFGAWRLAAGVPARLFDGAIHFQLEPGSVGVDLKEARRPPRRRLPAISRLAGAHRTCQVRLAEIQKHLGCELRMDALRGTGRPPTVLGARLRDGALALGAAARGLARSPGGDLAANGRSTRADGKELALLRQAVAALVGLGPGLTPSGDDFLCGFMAAARASGPGPREALLETAAGLEGGPGRVAALNAAAASNLGLTSSLSAFLVRCAIEDFWPTPLVDLAEALAGEREPEAQVALGELCWLGHSSGCDVATGFLFGLESLGAGANLS
jgi:Protein of unknown function (DUF2877)